MKRQTGLCDAFSENKPPLAQLAEEKKQQKEPTEKDWEREYSYEEKMLKARLDGQGYGEWEKNNRLWEIENGLIPTVEDWENEYSFEEKRLRSLLDKDGSYYRWEKQNWLWERENHRVPFEGEEDEMNQKEVRFLLSALSLQDPKKAEAAFHERLRQLQTKVLTEEEKKLKESYLDKEEKWRLGSSKEIFFPFGPGWDLAYHTLNPSVQFPPPSQVKQKFPPIPESLLHLCRTPRPCSSVRAISEEEELQELAALWEEQRGILSAQGRCLDGNYLTPYCKCDKECYRFHPTCPQELRQIWFAYCRQYRQSHCFDIDDYIGEGVSPLTPFQDFQGKAEIMMELANRAIQEYNEKEFNVFKYKVLKIEKVNFTVAMYFTFWMTVKVLNLTLGTPIETFQIHVSTSYVNGDKVIDCCRPKEEDIVGLPSCEFCFGLLPKVCVTEGKEP